MPRPIFSISLILLGFLAIMARPAHAQSSEQGALDLQIAIVDGCSVAADTMYFGILFGTTTSVQTSATISVLCTPDLDFNVSIDHGQNSLGVNRRMRNLTNGSYMRYRVYSDPAYSRTWSDKRNERVSANSGSTGVVSLTAYGEIPAVDVQGATGGVYQDTVTVTIDF